MNMLELQLLTLISGVPERQSGPTLLDVSSAVPTQPLAATMSASPPVRKPRIP
jgi:hypothetical protein